MRRTLVALGLCVVLAGLSWVSARPAAAQDEGRPGPFFSLCIRPLIHKAIDLPFPLPNLFSDPIPEKPLELSFGGNDPKCHP